MAPVKKAEPAPEAPPVVVSRNVILNRKERYVSERNQAQINMHRLDGAIALCDHLLTLMAEAEEADGK